MDKYCAVFLLILLESLFKPKKEMNVFDQNQINIHKFLTARSALIHADISVTELTENKFSLSFSFCKN